MAEKGFPVLACSKYERLICWSNQNVEIVAVAKNVVLHAFPTKDANDTAIA